MDIEDTKKLFDTMESSTVHSPGKEHKTSPDRVFQALSVSRTGRGQRYLTFLEVSAVLALGSMWFFVFCGWFGWLIGQPRAVAHSIGEFDLDNNDDHEGRVTLLFVGTLLVCLHVGYQFYHGWQTRAIITPDQIECRLKASNSFPAMWFTSEDARDDLKDFIAKTRGVKEIARFYPEELANLAVESSELAGQLRCALQHSQHIMRVANQITAFSQELGIELIFFDDSNKKFVRPNFVANRDRVSSCKKHFVPRLDPCGSCQNLQVDG